ncbi:MAG: PAS domain-containing protein, partial [Rubrimonas sp.]
VARARRLAVRRRYAALDMALDPILQSLAATAAILCDAPVAAVNLIGRDRTHIAAIVGAESEGTPLDVSICRLAVEDGAPVMHIPDALAEPRTACNPHVTAPGGVRLYAGALLRSPEGAAIGTICVVDPAPRALSPQQLRGLEALAVQAMAILELRRAHRRLAGELENLREAVFVLDADLRFARVNDVAEEMFGTPGAGLIGLRPWEVEGQSAAAARGLRRALDGPTAASGRTGVAVRVGPQGRWIEMDVEPADGAVAVHARELRGLRAERIRSALLEAAIQQTGDMILVGEIDGESDDPQPAIVFANRAFEARTGFAPADYMGKPPSILRGPGSDPAENHRLRLALRAGENVRSEVLCYGKTGAPMWLDLNGAPIRNGEGVLTNWIAVYRDVTERKAEQARLEALVEVAADAIYEYDIVGGRMIFSEGIRSAFGHDWVGEFAIPSPWAAHVHPDDLPRVRREMLEAMAGDAQLWRGDYRMRRGDGSWAEISERCRILRDERGRPVRAIGTLVDVTRERSLEQQLRQVQRMEAVGRLTGGVAHDFNNLLTVVLGNAELLEERLAHDEVAGPMARIVREAAERGARLVAQLLAFARRQPLDPRPTDVAAVLEGMREMLTSSLGREVELTIAVERDAPPALVDPGQLESALLNLALNARDAMPSGGRLAVTVRRLEIGQNGAGAPEAAAGTDPLAPGVYAAVVVRDEGVGMDPSVRARAFEPFFTTKEPGGGSGLGLSMVHGFALQSAGGAWIESVQGEGTAVTLALPAASAAPQADMPGRPKVASGGETVLMVEDDPMVREHVAAQLTSLGYRIVVARDGREALTLLTERPDVELLFTDIVMPGGMNGRSLAELARALRPDLPILFTTGFEATAAEGGAMQAVRVLRKPYLRHNLASALREALEGRDGARH